MSVDNRIQRQSFQHLSSGYLVTASNRHNDIKNIKILSSELTIWLRDSALPLWSTAGIDSQTKTSLDVIDLKTGAGLPVTRRARVVSRQIYSFLAVPLVMRT